MLETPMISWSEPCFVPNNSYYTSSRWTQKCNGSEATVETSNSDTVLEWEISLLPFLFHTFGSVYQKCNSYWSGLMCRPPRWTTDDLSCGEAISHFRPENNFKTVKKYLCLICSTKKRKWLKVKGVKTRILHISTSINALMLFCSKNSSRPILKSSIVTALNCSWDRLLHKFSSCGKEALGVSGDWTFISPKTGRTSPSSEGIWHRTDVHNSFCNLINKLNDSGPSIEPCSTSFNNEDHFD